MTSDRPAPPPADVRMRGFARRTTVEVVLAWIDVHCRPMSGEQISIWQAAGRVLAADIISRVDVPGFARSMMDGFALQAADTLGATAYNRLEAQIIGQSLPGKPFVGVVQRHQTVRIMTGAPLPASCDAVLPAEQVETDGQTLFMLDQVPPG